MVWTQFFLHAQRAGRALVLCIWRPWPPAASPWALGGGEGVADLIENGKNGFLVPPEEPAAIAELIEWV